MSEVLKLDWTERDPPADVKPEKISAHNDLIRIWPWIRDRLVAIKKKDPNAGHWVPEHVRHLLMLGIAGQSTCELFVARRGEKVYAFIVTEITIDRYIHVPTVLHVWAGWLNRSMIEKFLPFLDQLARERGVTRITFETGRFGWQGTIDALADRGFVQSTIIYSREVT
jgi:hypothetical protein